jgi:hypothetical protein
VVEKPFWDLTVFKLHFGKLTAKIYSKGERVLRIEAIVHDARELRCGKELAASRKSRPLFIGIAV